MSGTEKKPLSSLGQRYGRVKRSIRLKKIKRSDSSSSSRWFITTFSIELWLAQFM